MSCDFSPAHPVAGRKRGGGEGEVGPDNLPLTLSMR